MVLLMDSDRAVDITIRPHMDGHYGPDWSADFFDVGGLCHYPVVSGPREREMAHIVGYVGDCISSAHDMGAGVRDFELEGPQPEQVVDVEEINVDGVRLQSCIGPDLQTGTELIEFRRTKERNERSTSPVIAPTSRRSRWADGMGRRWPPLLSARTNGRWSSAGTPAMSVGRCSRKSWPCLTVSVS